MQIDDEAVWAQKKSKKSPVGSGREQCESFGVVMCVRGENGNYLSQSVWDHSSELQQDTACVMGLQWPHLETFWS